MPNTTAPVRHVLLVEDDEEDYQFTKELLEELDGIRHELGWASDYQQALEASRNTNYDVCLVDYRLGADNGIDLARTLIAEGHKMPVILLTGQDDPDVDEQAARAGAADFLVKGQISAAILERTIRYAIQSHAALRQLHKAYRTTVTALAAALELRDDQTCEHATRVTDLALQLTQQVAPELAADPELEYGFLLHDIGKIGVPDAIVLKPGPLTPGEMRQMRGHVQLGQQLIARIPHLNGLARQIVACHHEKWDGSGYPNRLHGHDIPLAARIFAVVDAFDAITNNRPYRYAQSTEHALREITNAAGTQFDPTIAHAFVALIHEQHDATPPTRIESALVHLPEPAPAA
jgi:cyclic di-GMP phosphodiesterase